MKNHVAQLKSFALILVLFAAFTVSPSPHAMAHCGKVFHSVCAGFDSVINGLVGEINTAIGIISDIARIFSSGDAPATINDLNDVGGDLISLGGDLASLGGDLTNLGGDIAGLGGDIFDVTVDFNSFSNILDGDLSSLGGDIGSGFTDAFSTISGLSGSTLSDFATLTSDLTDLGGSMDLGFSDLAQDFGGQFLDSTSFFKEQFTNLTDDFQTVVEDLFGEIDGVFFEIAAVSEDAAGGFASFGQVMGEGFTSMNDKIGGYGSRFGGSISRMVTLGNRLATVVSNPDDYLEAMTATLSIVEILPEMTTATLDFTTQLDTFSAVIDNLPEIVEALPALVEFSNEFPILIVELQTNLIANAPQIIEGLPELIGTKVDNFFLNVNEDVTVLLGLIPALEGLSDINDLSDTTNSDIANKVQEISDAVDFGFQSVFNTVASLQSAALAATEPSSAGAISYEQVRALEQEIEAAKARILALREENQLLEQAPAFDSAEAALLWLLGNEPAALAQTQ